MKNKLLFMVSIMSMVLASQAIADPLLLSDAEMQKLKTYFPAQDAGIHLTWQGDPLTITLPVGKEKRIVFPVHVTFDAKGALSTDQVRIINNDKSLYLTALKSLSATRIYVTLQNTNEVVLLDLMTTDKADNTTTFIDIKQNNTDQAVVAAPINATAQPTNTQNLNNQPIASTSDNDNYVTLMRFAWQQLYAPERLLSNPLGIARAPMHTQPMLSNLIYGDKVYAHPEVSWVYNNTYITAVELRNKYPHPATIVPSRDLCGDWQAVTFYPSNQLKPAGDKTGDSTMLFLVSAKPFGDSMEVCNGHA